MAETVGGRESEPTGDDTEDQRVVQIAKAMHAASNFGTSWPMLGPDLRQALLEDAADWLHVAINVGLLPAHPVPTGHAYLSTACHHETTDGQPELHASCRQTCKFCGAKCDLRPGLRDRPESRRPTARRCTAQHHPHPKDQRPRHPCGRERWGWVTVYGAWCP